jgi:RNA polymerase sigma-54 factor
MLNTNIDIKQSQSLTLTPRLQQAIKLLQMSHVELNELVNQYVDDNPFLAKIEGDYDGLNDNIDRFDKNESEEPESLIFDDTKEFDPTRPFSLRSDVSLSEHLWQQWSIEARDIQEKKVGEYLIDQLNADGYIFADMNEICETLKISKEYLDQILARLQMLDPVGVFSRDLKECFKLQLADKGKLTAPLKRFLENLDLLMTSGIDKLAQKADITIPDAQEYIKTIRTLTAKPGLQYESSPVINVIPDIFIKRANNQFFVELNPATLPKLFVQSEYYQMLKLKCKRGEDLSYLSEQLSTANWLINSLEQRSLTLIKITQSILKHQENFFNEGLMALRPLSLKEIADDAGVHESTVSRVTTNKYVATPMGQFELKFFFSSKISSTSKSQDGTGDVSSKKIMVLIKEIIQTEEPSAPLSDDNLAILLQHKGYNVARRTIAKYRGILNIASSSERKNMYKIQGKGM